MKKLILALAFTAFSFGALAQTNPGITPEGAITPGHLMNFGSTKFRASDGGINPVTETATALSVWGRSANTNGIRADISTVTNGHVLFNQSGTLLFNFLSNTNIAASAAITLNKLANGTALSLTGNATNGAAAHTDIACTATAGGVFRESGSTLGCGQITYAAFPTAAALTVLGNPTNGSAVPTEINCPTDKFVIQRNGTSIVCAILNGANLSVGANIALTQLANIAANTVVANGTGSAAAATAFGMPSCSAAGNALQWLSNTGFQCGSLASLAVPTYQKFLTGSGTYTTPSSPAPRQLIGRMVGAGSGGGSGNGTGSSAGGNTCWNTTGAACTTPVYQAGGGGGAPAASTSANGAVGGTVSGSGTCNIAVAGGDGDSSTIAVSGTVAAKGGHGGNSYLGGAGSGGLNTSAGLNAKVNTGGGGGGGGQQSSATAGAGPGGAAGAYCEFIINSPAATYTYAVGAKSAGSTSPGSGGSNGGDGADGGIWVQEIY